VIPLLRGFPTDPIPVSLLHRPHRTHPIKRRAFLDFVLPRLSQALAAVDKIVAAP
jgi:hypothetical protein